MEIESLRMEWRYNTGLVRRSQSTSSSRPYYPAEPFFCFHWIKLNKFMQVVDGA